MELKTFIIVDFLGNFKNQINALSSILAIEYAFEESGMKSIKLFKQTHIAIEKQDLEMFKYNLNKIK